MTDDPATPESGMLTASELLALATRAWANENPESAVALADECYSTAGNGFLALAEQAWFEARDDYRTPPPPPTPRAGVYFLYGEPNELLYVGASGNLGRRLGDHFRRHHGEIKEVVVAPYDDRAERHYAEALAIEYLSPAHNIQHAGSRRW